MRVINIRGANGSGKTTLVRALLASDPDRDVVDIEIGPAHTKGHYLVNKGIVVIGPYVDAKATGGMDNVKTTEEAVNAVYAATRGDWVSVGDHIPFDGDPATEIKAVVFEGILISTVYSTWLAVSQRLKVEQGRGMTWAFLSTTGEVCLERVRQRRAEKGRPETGFKEALVLDKVKSISSIIRKAQDAGEHVVMLGPIHELSQLEGLCNG